MVLCQSIDFDSFHGGTFTDEWKGENILGSFSDPVFGRDYFKGFFFDNVRLVQKVRIF